MSWSGVAHSKLSSVGRVNHQRPDAPRLGAANPDRRPDLAALSGHAGALGVAFPVERRVSFREKPCVSLSVILDDRATSMVLGVVHEVKVVAVGSMNVVEPKDA